MVNSIDYVDYLIEQLKIFVENDSDLSIIIPKNMNYFTGEEEYNITETYKSNNEEEDIYPLITVKTLQNNARSFNVSNYEIATDVSWQIDIYSMSIDYNGIIPPDKACKLIRDKIKNFIEKKLKFNRIFVSDPIPIDTTNQVYGLYLRYNAVHNLLNNTIIRR